MKSESLHDQLFRQMPIILIPVIPYASQHTCAPMVGQCLPTRVLRLPLLSLATDTDTEREKYFPGDALLGLLDTESWEPVKLRSRASPDLPAWMDEGLRVVCIPQRPVERQGESSFGTIA